MLDSLWASFVQKTLSIATVEEESDARDDPIIGRSIVGQIERAKKFLSIQTVVYRCLNCLILGIGISIRLRNPINETSWKLLNFGGILSDFSQLTTVKCATLQPQTVKLDNSGRFQSSLFQRGYKLEFINGNAQLSGRLLPQSIQERFGVK